MRRKNATTADALLAHVQPLVDRFARQLADTLGTYLNAATERVMGEAMERFEGMLELRPQEPKARGFRKPKVTVEVAKAPKKTPKCSRCGEGGHNARSCTKAQPTEATDDEDDDEPAPVKRGGDRFAKIEAAAARRNGASHA